MGRACKSVIISGLSLPKVSPLLPKFPNLTFSTEEKKKKWGFGEK